MIAAEINNGYTEANAEAKVCQDIVLDAIARSSLNRNMTIKGGVVMRSRTGNIRRATQDLDIDFIKYSLSDESIDAFISKLNSIDGIHIERNDSIEELRQQDYHGKRVYIIISDDEGNQISSKIDLGVHKNLEIEQEEYGFDIAFDEQGASLLINSNEQMFAEKLRSLLKFGPASTRYKDISDMYYLIHHISKGWLKTCMDTYIYNDPRMREHDKEDIVKRLSMTFSDKTYRRALSTSRKKWIDEDIQTIFDGIIKFIEKTI